MLPETLFDTTRFDTEEEAKAKGEAYSIEYKGGNMIITTPSGYKKVIKLAFTPVCGLDALDYGRLSEFVNKDMERRENEA